MHVQPPPPDGTAAEARAALAAAPSLDLAHLCPPGAVLIIAPHPDDETLGCGGMIARALEAGRTVRVAILTDGAGSHPSSIRVPPARLARMRRREARSALRELGDATGAPAHFGAPDGGLRRQEDGAVEWLTALVREEPVGSIFTTWDADPHLDHKAAFRVAQAVAQTCEAVLRAYPVWGLTLADDHPAGPTRPCVALDVSTVLDRKRRAVLRHRSQTSSLIPDAVDDFRLSAADMARHLAPREPFLLF
ncbi:PIG-L family deacetylase [soil metagenome]